MKNKKNLSPAQVKDLLALLEERFKKNTKRHKQLEWKKIQEKLETNPEKLWSLNEMEQSGGEPDVISYDKKNDEYLFVDCAPESPKERRSLCYDEDARESRKANKPKDSALKMAENMGISILTEKEYRDLQELGEFDLKTSSWVHTPDKIRELGGALFCDRRFNQVFLYHNGAESYYAARGFRGALRV